MLWHPWDWDFDSLAVFQILSHLPLHYVSPHLNSLFSLTSWLLDMTQNIFEIRSITAVICRVAWLKVYLECSSGNNQSLALVLTGPLNVHHALLISELTHYWPVQSALGIPTVASKESWQTRAPAERRVSRSFLYSVSFDPCLLHPPHWSQWIGLGWTLDLRINNL